MKRVLLFIAVLVLVMIGISYFWLNYSGKAAGNKQADISIAATALYQDYSSDEQAGNAEYLDKILEVEGTVIDITQDEQGAIVLILGKPDEFSGVMCTLLPEEKADGIEVGDQVTIRGKCTGMLTDVVLNQCVLIS